jgi:Predicted transcriptional regulators
MSIDRKPTNRVRELREARGWSQHDLAMRAGMTAKTIHNVERGRGPSLDTAMAIAAVLGQPVEEIFPVIPA